MIMLKSGVSKAFGLDEINRPNKQRENEQI